MKMRLNCLCPAVAMVALATPAFAQSTEEIIAALPEGRK